MSRTEQTLYLQSGKRQMSKQLPMDLEMAFHFIRNIISRQLWSSRMAEDSVTRLTGAAELPGLPHMFLPTSRRKVWRTPKSEHVKV